uniref:G-protein coupled receptors family 1 profile domain-containing protein n=1 Tax=Anopheles atroparvus TaxID=41427 RepID=A0A182IJA3_ANOAO
MVPLSGLLSCNNFLGLHEGSAGGYSLALVYLRSFFIRICCASVPDNAAYRRDTQGAFVLALLNGIRCEPDGRWKASPVDSIAPGLVEQSVNTASDSGACPPPSSRGSVVGELRAGYGGDPGQCGSRKTSQSDHVLPVRHDSTFVARFGRRNSRSVATSEQDSTSWLLQRRAVSLARPSNAPGPSSWQHPRGEKQHVASPYSGEITKRNKGSRTSPRLSATAVWAATAVLSTIFHLITVTSAYSIEGDPGDTNASSWNALGNHRHGYNSYAAYGNRFGRLLLNGTRTILAAAATTNSSTATGTTSSPSEPGPFDGDRGFVAAGGTVSAGFNESSEMPQIPEYIRATSMVFCIIIMCLGVIGNIMVPIVILKTKDMRNSTNIFLTNLSIADLLVLLVCTPTVLVEVNSPPEVWVLGEEMYVAPLLSSTENMASMT